MTFMLYHGRHGYMPLWYPGPFSSFFFVLGRCTQPKAMDYERSKKLVIAVMSPGFLDSLAAVRAT